jgi:hypothetical protein
MKKTGALAVRALFIAVIILGVSDCGKLQARRMGGRTGAVEATQDSGPGRKRTAQTLALHLFALASITPSLRSFSS